MNGDNGREQQIEALYPDMIRWRRYLHQHPELSFQEKETSAWLAKLLEDMGCQVKCNQDGYGIVVAINGHRQALL